MTLRTGRRDQAVGGAIPSQINCHDDFFEGSIASPLPNAVDGTFQLARSSSSTGKTVSSGQTQIILAMCRNDYILCAWGLCLDPGDEISKLMGEGPACCVRNVEGSRACFDDFGQDAVEEVDFRSAGIFRAEFDIMTPSRFEVLYSLDCIVYDLVWRHLELVLHVNGGSRNEDMHSWPLCVFDCIPSCVQIPLLGPAW